MADTGNFSQFFFFTTEAGLYIKGKLLRVVHGCNKVNARQYGASQRTVQMVKAVFVVRAHFAGVLCSRYFELPCC